MLVFACFRQEFMGRDLAKETVLTVGWNDTFGRGVGAVDHRLQWQLFRLQNTENCSIGQKQGTCTSWCWRVLPTAAVRSGTPLGPNQTHPESTNPPAQGTKMGFCTNDVSCGSSSCMNSNCIASMHVMSLHKDGKVVWFLCAKPLCLHGDDCAPRQTPPKARRRSPWRKPSVVCRSQDAKPPLNWFQTGFKRGTSRFWILWSFFMHDEMKQIKQSMVAISFRNSCEVSSLTSGFPPAKPIPTYPHPVETEDLRRDASKTSGTHRLGR